jgi:ribosome-binding protein aMBF1 (putative translation factor)
MTETARKTKAGGQFGEDWLGRFEQKYEDDPDFIAEGLALGVTEEAAEIMERQGISRAELAARMGVSRAYVTQLLNARPNLTLRSLAQLAIALQTKLSIHLDTDPAGADDRVPTGGDSDGHSPAAWRASAP